jgi:hypothetical protein
MKNTKLPWYIFIFLCITKIIFLILSILLATKTIYIYPFSNVNNTTSFLLRNILTTILQISAYILFTKKKYFKNKELTTVLCLFTFPVFLDALGNIFAWYSTGKLLNIFYFDDLVHFLFPLLMYVGIYILTKVKGRKSELLSATVSISLTTFWELYEYWCDVLLDTDLVNGLKDTMTDLTYGVMGVLVGFAILRIWKRDR